MNIKSLSALNFYKSNSVGASQSTTGTGTKNEVAKEHALAAEKKDTVQISSEAATLRDINRMVKAVMKDIEEFDSPARLHDIKTAIENSTYNVSSQDVADEILTRLGE